MSELYGANLGFFSNPICLGKQVLKGYSLKMKEEEIDRLVKQHETFILQLSGVGINIPKTEARKVEVSKGRYSIEIIQERFEQTELAGEMVKNSDANSAVLVGVRIAQDAIKFLTSDLYGKIGFHPTIRNYAFRSGIGYMIDTFPPYSDIESTRKLMRQSAPNLRSKIVMNIFPPVLGFYSREYYSPAPMICGIVGTMSRLRPEIVSQARTEIKDLVSRVQASWRDEVLEELDKNKHLSRAMWKLAHLFYN
jgi:hypothetical protein